MQAIRSNLDRLVDPFRHGTSIAPTFNTGCYDTPESFSEVVVRRNTIVNVGNSSIVLNACRNCLIENNIVINDQNHNVSAIAFPAGDEHEGDINDDAITVRNNSIYIDGGTAISLEGEGSGHLVVGNAILSSARRPTAGFEFGGSAQTYRQVDYNICPGAAGRWSKSFENVAAWSAQSGFDRHSAQTNPGFSSTTAPLYDLSPTADSALLNHGDPANSPPDDHSGKKRLNGAPDVGALER